MVSGKGGVGKSLVTSLMAVLMRCRGHNVAILDADITGPSIPKSFGIREQLVADEDGILIVTSPQELVGMIVEKAANMAKMMNIPVLRIIENMSYFKCDGCGREHHIFGESHLEEIADRSGIGEIARLPIDASIAKACDSGSVEELRAQWLDDIADMIEAV